MAEIKRIISQEVPKANSNKSPTIVEDIYTIPNGQNLGIDYFFGGHEYSTKEIRIELVLRDGSDTILAAGYGSYFNLRVKQDINGNGTRAVVIRLINGDKKSSLHMTGSWYGDIQ